MRAVLISCAAVAILGGVVVVRALSKPRDSGEAPHGPSGAPGIVLLCIDTLRADGVDHAGGADASMPSLDEFARGATVFADASAAAAWTAPSVSTLLTGLTTEHHGVRGSALGEEGDLLPSVTTVAEILKAAGWSTVAFTGGGWLTQEHGIAQGFNGFAATFDSDGPEADVAMWERRQRPPDQPFFLFLHTFAAHDPYGRAAKTSLARGNPSPAADALAKDVLRRISAGEAEFPPNVYRDLVTWFLLDGEARKTFGEVLGAAHRIDVWRACMRWMDEGFARDPDSAALGARLRAAYVAGLRDADDVVALTLNALGRARVPADTVVIVTGDHGEAFGEHGTISHGRWLYDELLRVPLVVRAPGPLPAGKVVHGSCGLVDLLPTILDLAGVAVPPGLDGTSLLPLARGVESGHPVTAREARHGMRKGAPVDWEVASVRTEAAKFIVTVEVPGGETREELFDLATDPGEAKPLPGTDLERFGPAFRDAVGRVRSEMLDRGHRSAGSAPGRPPR